MTRLAKAAVGVWGGIAVVLFVVLVSLTVAPRSGAPPDQDSGGPPPRAAVSLSGMSFSERCVEKSEAAARRARSFLVSHGWRREATVFDDAVIKDKYSRDHKGQVAAVVVPHELEIRFIKDSGEMIMYFDLLGFECAVGSNSRLYESPPRAAWTREKAIAVASGYVRAVLGGEPAKTLKLLFARHNHPYMEAPKYYAGVWHVKWARTDSQGHEFDADYVLVKMNEEYGPSFLRITLPSRYEEGPVTVIGESTAIDNSRDHAAKIVRRWLPRDEINGKPSASLRIVNPNRILEMTNVYELGIRGDLNARLAWVVKYNTIRAASGLGPIRSSVSVWIDAADGSFLGGKL